MGRFRFTLEPLRRVREHAETAAGLAVAEELAVGRRLDERLRAAELAAAEAQSGAAALAAGVVGSTNLLAYRWYAERRLLEASVAAVDVDDQTLRIAQKRQALADAARDRAVLERLRDKLKAAHDQEAFRAEVRILDDLAIVARRRQEAA